MNIIKEHIEHLKDNPQRLWFKKRLYGWGWIPATKEGWFVFFGYITAVIFIAYRIEESAPLREFFFTFVLPFVLLTYVLIRICYLKGEKPKWMWGPEKTDDNA